MTAAKQITLDEVGETLAYIVEHMATKDDIALLSEQIAGIEQELKTIRRDLNALAEKVANIEGYGKEIDHALERIAAIEKHLGMRPRAAA